MGDLESTVVVLNNQRYLVYLKRVAVKSGKKEQNFIIKPFVKRLGKNKSKLDKFVKDINKNIDRLVDL
tara:strand:+ start:817 stop:1020 length:204 start_codon:yes stop_codon:yes gene_type:complete